MAKKKGRYKPKIAVFEELSERAYNVVANSGIHTIDELAAFHQDALDQNGIYKLRGVGKKTFNELDALLKKHGRSWKKRTPKQ